MFPRHYVAFQPLLSTVDDFEVSESDFAVLRVLKAISTKAIEIIPCLSSSDVCPSSQFWWAGWCAEYFRSRAGPELGHTSEELRQILQRSPLAQSATDQTHNIPEIRAAVPLVLAIKHHNPNH